MKKATPRYLAVALGALVLMSVDEVSAQNTMIPPTPVAQRAQTIQKAPTSGQMSLIPPIPGNQRRGSPPPLRRSQRPSLSPYLNLAAAGGNSDAASFAYFQLTLPQQAAQRSRATQDRQIRGLNQEVAQQREMLMQSPTSNLGTTGHRVGFMSYGTYFNK